MVSVQPGGEILGDAGLAFVNYKAADGRNAIFFIFYWQDFCAWSGRAFGCFFVA